MSKTVGGIDSQKRRRVEAKIKAINIALEIDSLVNDLRSATNVLFNLTHISNRTIIHGNINTMHMCTNTIHDALNGIDVINEPEKDKAFQILANQR